MKNTTKVWTALFSGMAVGAILGVTMGILFAPDKGSETRKKIKEEGKKVMDGLGEKIREEKENLSSLKESLVQNARQKAHEFFEQS